jgi:PAT family beta-lactamase induction signal transducer AmpG
MSVVLFKNFQASNDFVGFFTSLLYFPWTLKFLWAPNVDFIGSRRQWIVVSQIVLGVLALMCAGAVAVPNPIYPLFAVFVVMALASATQDVAIDGFYLDALNVEQQSLYVGIRNAAYKVATLLGSGALVYMAGKITESHGLAAGWGAAFAICALVMLAAASFHYFKLPHPKQEVRTQLDMKQFAAVFKTFFQQEKITAIIVYILIFRLGDALMLKMAQPFLLDPLAKGGLGISTADVGLIYGTVGTLFLLVGGLLGGWLVSRFGLKKCLLPTAIIQNSAILLYWALSIWKPNLIAVAAVNGYEQFSYGLGTAAYTVFLLSTVRPEFKAAHYATATAFMALGIMVPGMASGYIQEALGYQNFFLLSFLSSIPGMFAIFFLPIKERKTTSI